MTAIVAIGRVTQAFCSATSRDGRPRGGQFVAMSRTESPAHRPSSLRGPRRALCNPLSTSRWISREAMSVNVQL